MNKIEPVEGFGVKRPFFVKINGVILLSANGRMVRFKDSITATLGATREIDRRKKLAVTLASRMPEARDTTKPGDEDT
jgi:hypothetical protein